MTTAPALSRHPIDVVLLTSLSIAALLTTATMALQPRDPQSGVAVVFMPWTAPDAVLRRAGEAGGRFVRFGGLPFIAVVIPDDADYPSRVLAAGAWLVVDPQMAAACLGTSAIPARQQ